MFNEIDMVINSRTSLSLLAIPILCIAGILGENAAGENFDYQKAAKEIDGYVFDNLKKEKLEPNPTIRWLMYFPSNTKKLRKAGNLFGECHLVKLTQRN